jgi:hypothetical protein
MQQDLSIRMVALKNATERLQLSSQLEVIIDLAVEDDDAMSIRERHWLRAAGEIDYRKPTMTEVNSLGLLNIKSLSVRAAVGDTAGHAFEIALIPFADKSGDPAHSSRLRKRCYVARLANEIDRLVLRLVERARDHFRE